MHELTWRIECLRTLGPQRAKAHFATHDERFAAVTTKLDALDALSPGPELVTALAELQTMTLDCAGQVRLIAQWARVEAWVQACSIGAWAAALHGGDTESDRLVAAEVALATHTSHGSAQSRVSLAQQLTEQLAPALPALEDGELSMAHVRALAEATRHVSDETGTAVARRTVPKAIAAGWTPSELKRAARRAVRSLDPDGEADRHERAKDNADVRFYAEDHDMATILATTDAPTARRLMDTLDDRAAELRRNGDTRPIGVLRSTALADAVLGDPSTRPPAEVVVTIDLATLLGLNRTPGELSGYGPITAEVALDIARDATLRRLVTDPITGMAIDLGRHRYRPSTILRRVLNARDRVCRFPGCQRPAQRCDADHLRPWDSGGHTGLDNLQPLCRMHHGFKTEKAWQVHRDANGISTWVGPLGFRSTRPPATYPHDGPDRKAALIKGDFVTAAIGRRPVEHRFAIALAGPHPSS
jgi:Domain of unknown function (DUF222)/HNH endonuclease